MNTTVEISTFHKIARDLAGRGTPIFPCWPNTKRPMSRRGFLDATIDLAQVDRWWSTEPNSNPGFSPHTVGQCVIDLDGQAGIEAYRSVKAEFELEDTYTVRTPRGGLHLYFMGELPGTAWTPTGKRTLGHHIDTRGVGSYVLAPGSYVDDGKAKGWYNVEKDIEPAFMNLAVAKRLEPIGVTTAVEGERDLPYAIEQAARFLRDCVRTGRVSIQQQGGNETCYKIACNLVRDLGLSPDRATDLMLEHWYEHCKPHDKPEFVWRLCHHANKYGQNSPGAFTSAPGSERFKEAIEKLRKEAGADDPPQRQKPVPVPMHSLRTRKVDPVVDTIKGVVERGLTTFLSAAGGLNKSRTGIAWGQAVSHGQPIYGLPVRQSTFHYLSYEDSYDEVTRRVQKISDRIGLPADSDNAHYWDLTGKEPNPLINADEKGKVSTQPFYEELRAELKSQPGEKFVVVDSAYDALWFLGASKVSEMAVKAAIRCLDWFCRDTGSTLLVLWHPSQAGQDRGDNAGWSVAWHNAPRARLSLSHPEKDDLDLYELRCEKRNNGPRMAPLMLRWSDGILVPASESALEGKTQALRKACIKAALSAAASGMPITKQKHVTDWQLRDIDNVAGYRPTQRAIKEALTEAVNSQKLRYVAGHGKKSAGFYPFTLDAKQFANDCEDGQTELAMENAKAASRRELASGVTSDRAA